MPPRTSPKYKIHCKDAKKWLASVKDHSLGNVVTGIPDFMETGMEFEEYINFIMDVVLLIFKKVAKDGYCLFMNTDRKQSGWWLDKGFLIQTVAKQVKIPLKWHKIILLRGVGRIHLQRPTFQHYLCFSYEGKPGIATPDVFECGHKEYKNSSCPHGVEHAIKFIKQYSAHQMVVDPFVGRGTTLLVAKKHGMPGIGVDIDKKQCEITEKILKI
jgi:DNA modification methylase